MERTPEVIEPSEALKLIASTLNSPSIKHERIEMQNVYLLTAQVLSSWQPRKLSITTNGVVTEGLTSLLAVVHAWKAAKFDVARDVKGERIYSRKGAKKSREVNLWQLESLVASSRKQ